MNEKFIEDLVFFVHFLELQVSNLPPNLLFPNLSKCKALFKDHLVN